jgi:hypothetical protein
METLLDSHASPSRCAHVRRSAVAGESVRIGYLEASGDPSTPGRQGHGEVDQTAIETGLRGRFQFFVRKDMKLKRPRAETPTHWVVMGYTKN